MGIDFGNLSGAGDIPVETTSSAVSGVLNLDKGMTLDLTKRNPGLEEVLVGAGWDVAETGADFDLDIAAFLLANGKVRSVGDVIFFNNKEASGVRLHGDNRTGAGDGDDEKISLELNKIDSGVDSIAFCVTIHEAASRGQTFGMVKNSFIRLVDEKGNKEMCRFALNTDFSTDTSVIFAKLKRNGGEWDFEAVGEGKQADLNGLLAYFS